MGCGGQICPLHCGIEHGVVDDSPWSCSIPNQLNLAPNWKRPAPKEPALAMVAGARYAQRCPVEFGVPMEVVIAG